MNVCDGLLHTVSEYYEIDFLLHLSALLRKQPGIAIMFFSNVRQRPNVTNIDDFFNVFK